jgi:hypothetical protein
LGGRAPPWQPGAAVRGRTWATRAPRRASTAPDFAASKIDSSGSAASTKVDDAAVHQLGCRKTTRATESSNERARETVINRRSPNVAALACPRVVDADPAPTRRVHRDTDRITTPGTRSARRPAIAPTKSRIRKTSSERRDRAADTSDGASAGAPAQARHRDAGYAGGGREGLGGASEAGRQSTRARGGPQIVGRSKPSPRRIPVPVGDKLLQAPSQLSCPGPDRFVAPTAPRGARAACRRAALSAVGSESTSGSIAAPPALEARGAEVEVGKMILYQGKFCSRTHGAAPHDSPDQICDGTKPGTRPCRGHRSRRPRRRNPSVASTARGRGGLQPAPHGDPATQAGAAEPQGTPRVRAGPGTRPIEGL